MCKGKNKPDLDKRNIVVFIAYTAFFSELDSLFEESLLGLFGNMGAPVFFAAALTLIISELSCVVTVAVFQLACNCKR